MSTVFTASTRETNAAFAWDVYLSNIDKDNIYALTESVGDSSDTPYHFN